jgi:hypothetical protein
MTVGTTRGPETAPASPPTRSTRSAAQRRRFIFLTGCGIQSLNLWGFCNGLRLFFFGHSQDCFLLTCHE